MPNGPLALDRFDRAILEVLATDGRISAVELARRIGLSKSPTQARMKRLEEETVGWMSRMNTDFSPGEASSPES